MYLYKKSIEMTKFHIAIRNIANSVILTKYLLIN